LGRSLRDSVWTRFVAKNGCGVDCGAPKIACYAKGMRDRYRLGGLGNDQLLAALSGLVRRENDLISDLLAHLAELDERRLYLDLGFTSLFAYCTEALGFCKSSAGRRIAVARVCRKYPEAFARIARGELQLSTLSLLASHLSMENAAELFEACKRKSCDQVEELLAARFPKPDVRDSIRRLPARPEARAPDGGRAPEVLANAIGSAEHPLAYALSEAGRETRAAETRRADEAETTDAGTTRPPLRGRPVLPAQRKLEPLSPDRFGVHFTADTEFRELLEEVRGLASHREAGGELLSLMKRGLEAYRRELKKQRFGVSCRSQRAPSEVALRGKRFEGLERSASDTLDTSDTLDASAALNKRGRYEVAKRRSRRIPAAVARAVYARDEGCCTFCSAEGRRCGARRFLELDHITPWAAGGASTVENLRLRCRAHNQHSARRYFGADFMRSKLVCAAPRACVGQSRIDSI
jgi:HNH endonuclease